MYRFSSSQVNNDGYTVVLVGFSETDMKLKAVSQFDLWGIDRRRPFARANDADVIDIGPRHRATRPIVNGTDERRHRWSPQVVGLPEDGARLHSRLGRTIPDAVGQTGMRAARRGRLTRPANRGLQRLKERISSQDNGIAIEGSAVTRTVFSMVGMPASGTGASGGADLQIKRFERYVPEGTSPWKVMAGHADHRQRPPLANRPSARRRSPAATVATASATAP